MLTDDDESWFLIFHFFRFTDVLTDDDESWFLIFLCVRFTDVLTDDDESWFLIFHCFRFTVVLADDDDESDMVTLYFTVSDLLMCSLMMMSLTWFLFISLFQIY